MEQRQVPLPPELEIKRPDIADLGFLQSVYDASFGKDAWSDIRDGYGLSKANLASSVAKRLVDFSERNIGGEFPTVELLDPSGTFQVPVRPLVHYYREVRYRDIATGEMWSNGREGSYGITAPHPGSGIQHTQLGSIHVRRAPSASGASSNPAYIEHLSLGRALTADEPVNPGDTNSVEMVGFLQLISDYLDCCEVA